MLDGNPVQLLHSDLTAGQDLDIAKARCLPTNLNVSFMGVTKSGPFDIPGELARSWLAMPNPHGQPNAEILSPSINGQDLARRPSGDWIINFGDRSEGDASLYEAPYAYAVDRIKPKRLESRTEKNRRIWWRFERARPEMFSAIGKQTRYIATCLVSKHRFFVWQHSKAVPENVVIVIARSDDTTFGVLHSRFHELWALRMCSWLGVGNDPRYTPTTTFETFPFPAGMTPADTAAGPPTGLQADAIAVAARRLNELRENWLNPAEWVDRVPEVASGFPDRIIPKPGHEAELKKRTLTNLYNLRPAWLEGAHKALDTAVAAAYGWTDYTPEMPDDEILRRLLALNLQRSNAATSAG